MCIRDSIIYTFTKNGRVEATNYRTLEMPTDREVPTFLKKSSLFGYFYKDVFQTNYRRTGRNDVYLEYAWDISGQQPVKCDPCVAPPISREDLQMAGVDWLTGSGTYYEGDVFITRMHTRYDRSRFPQDLQFQETPNRDHFQCRYVLRHPYQGEMKCDEAEAYLQQVAQRRQQEMLELEALTRWNTSHWKSYTDEYAAYLPTETGDASTTEQPHFEEASLNLSLPARVWLWVFAGIAFILLVYNLKQRLRGRKSS